MKRSGRHSYKLPEVVFFQEGPGLRTYQWTSEGMKVINVTNILPNGSVDISNTDRHISLTEFESSYEHFAIKENDIVVASSGNTYGKVGRIRAEHLPLMMNTSVIRFHSADQSKLTDDYLYAYLRSPEFRAQVEAFVTGGAQPNFGPSHLKLMTILAPALREQQRIASILSAYDDLIENNRRRMALLEESARLLYQEWFVRLRFPGYEHTRIVDGVPEGWERKTLAELCESIDYGYTASAQQREVGPKFLRITDIVPDSIDWSAVPYCSIEEGRLEKFLLREGDIVVARTGATVGYAKQLHKRHPETVFASYLVRLRPKKTVSNFMMGVFVESNEYKKYVKSHVVGAAQPNANAKILSGADILIPPVTLQKTFDEMADALISQCEILQAQSQKLRKARDILLPLLINGEITV